MQRHNPTQLFMESPLDKLHAESVTWLSDLYFWEEELAFFAKLLAHAELSDATAIADLRVLEQQLIVLSVAKVGKIKAYVTSHERFLSGVLKGDLLSDECVYRKLHRKIVTDMEVLETEMQAFKNKLFVFAGVKSNALNH